MNVERVIEKSRVKEVTKIVKEWMYSSKLVILIILENKVISVWLPSHYVDKFKLGFTFTALLFQDCYLDYPKKAISDVMENFIAYHIDT